MDEDEEERRRGITINTAQAFLKTPNKEFVIIDAPGHKDFISNMIAGASQADSAILVVDSNTGAFETGFSGGGQTKDHVILARSLGVTQLCVAINKLDMVSWSEERYDFIIDQILPYLKSIGFKEQSISFVPISGLSGINLDNANNQPPELKKWYQSKKSINKQGKTLIETIECFRSSSRPLNKPTRVCIYDYFFKNKDGFSVTSGDCIQAKVESGVVTVKDKLIMMPQDVEITVKAISQQENKVNSAFAGQICEI